MLYYRYLLSLPLYSLITLCIDALYSSSLKILTQVSKFQYPLSLGTRFNLNLTEIIIVTLQIFTMEVYGANKVPLTVDQIHNELQSICNQSTQPGVPLGILTTENRTTWAEAYNKMKKGVYDTNHRGLQQNEERCV